MSLKSDTEKQFVGQVYQSADKEFMVITGFDFVQSHGWFYMARVYSPTGQLLKPSVCIVSADSYDSVPEEEFASWMADQSKLAKEERLRRLREFDPVGDLVARCHVQAAQGHDSGSCIGDPLSHH